MIDQLTDAECEITECVARRLNVVIEAVEALRRMFEQHIAAGDGADPVEGPMYPSHAAALRAVKRCEADVQALREDNETLRAERDAAQARVAELEKEDTERLERGREKARHMEKEIATLKHAVREARENLDYGHIWTPNDTQYVRDAIAALSAALDEEATDAE